MASLVKVSATVFLFKLLLGLTLLFVSIVRINLVSGIYLLCLLALPLIRSPSHEIHLKGAAGRYMKALVVLSALGCLSQVIYQIAQAGLGTYDDEKAPSYCNYTDTLWQQLGFQRLDDLNALNVARLVAPDVILLVVSLLVLVMCNYILVQPQTEDTDPAQDDGEESGRLSPVMERRPRRTSVIVDGLLSCNVMLFCALAGIVVPSALSSVYFVGFLVVVTWWSFYQTWGRVFKWIEVVWLIYSGCHVVVLYLAQFQFFQEAMPVEPDEKSGLPLTAFIGLTPIVDSLRCNVGGDPRELVFYSKAPWPIFVNPAILILFYWFLGHEVYRWLAGPEYVEFVRHKKKGRKPRDGEKQRLVSEAGPSYHTMDDPSQEQQPKESAPLTTTDGGESALTSGDEEGHREGVKMSPFTTFIIFLTKQSYIAGLILMMAWSIVYLSWLTFVLLLWAILIWIIPISSTRSRCLYTSPLLVIYAELIIIGTFVYNMNTNLPEEAGGVNLREVGLIQYENPFIPLLAQLAFTVMFWLTLRQFMREKRLRKHNVDEGIVLQPFGVIFSGPKDEVAAFEQNGRNPPPRSHSVTMTFMGSKLQGILSKYWILLCGLMFLIISLQGTVDIFKVVYMLLFLLILNIFVISFTVFRFILRVFGWFVVLYSIAVLCMIYTYQFEDIRRQWSDGTPLTAEELKILGLQQYNDVSELLLVLLIPTAFIILVMIQLSYFHNHFLEISKISNEGYRASHLDKTEEEETGGEEGQEEGAGSREVAKVIIDEEASQHGRSSTTPTPTFKQQVVKAYRYFSKFVEPVEMFLWRLLEIHMMKIVFFAIILVITMEVTAVNGILLLLIFLPIVFESLHRLSCIISLVWISLVVVSKMLFQLEFSVWFSNSTLTKDCNQSEDFPSIGEFNITTWFGYEKVDYSFYAYVEGYVAIIVMIIIQSIVTLHQRQYRLQRGLIKPVYSIVFDDISREIADKGVFECMQYLFNYCFYKFGLEICFSTTMIVAAVRLDFIAFLYIVLALPFFFVRRRTCASLWPIYTLILAILLPITYALALGLPPMLCISYPWFDVSQLPPEIVAWLYLPNYEYPLESSVIVADFFQLLFVALQWHVFRNESNGDVKAKGGDNYEVSVDVEKVEENPVPNFTFNKSYLDFAKNLIFGYMFYVTLAIVFLCATTRISILGLFYLVFAFYFLWYGPKFLTKPTPVVIKRWNLLLGYNIFVITMKVALQIVACGYESELSSSNSCWVMQLFGVTCLQNYNFDNGDSAAEPCQLPADQAQLTWDVTCFFFIVFQRRIFTSNYFLYVVLDLQDEEKLASKGAELINEILASKVRNKRVEERNILEGVKRKMKRIKEKQAKLLSKKEAWQPTTHAEAIRATGGYYMFEDVDDDDLSEIEDMEAEGIIKTGEPSRKNPLQLMHHGIVEDPKRAIEIDAEHRAAAGEDADDVDADAVSYSTAISGDGADGPKVKDPKSLEEAQDDEDMVVEDDIDMEEDEPTSSKIKSALKLTWLVFIRTIDSIIAFLDNISEEYRYVAKELAKLTSEGKRRRALRKQRRMAEMQEMKSGSSVEMQDETQEEDALAVSTETEKTQTRDPKVTIVVPPTEHTVPQKSFPSNDDTASMTETSTSEQFQRTMIRPARLVYAALYALIAQSQLVCYFMIILNQLLSASILSLPLPLMVFLWAMLSVPRPTKRFWITVISYTMAVVLLKYLFQFPFTHEATNVTTQEMIDKAYTVIGIEKKANYAALDLCILLTVFFHRSVLIRHGLWQESRVVPNLDEQGGEVAAVQTSTDISVEDVDGDETDKGKKKKKKKRKKHKKKDTATGAAESGEKPEELPSSEDDLLENELQRSIRSITSHLSELEDKEPPWYQPAINFYHNMLDPMYSAVTDVYVFIFGVQFILFLIILFFSSSFGEEQGSSDVAQLITSNTIPISFLILLLVMFVLIIIDRAIYLCKDVRAKFVYLVTLVITLHIWLFFALPYYNNRLFVNNNPAQAWYFFLCIYFGLSAYQITSGYPTRILGNFLCRRYNLVSLVLFYGWRVIPFLTELRTLMDWIWTDTTLSLSHWLQVEDIYANIYPIKCFRNREIAYPVPRGTKTPRLIKYGVGGVGLLVLILIIWFPLILISLSNTTSLQNPITTASVEISFEGFEPIFKMTALSEDITQIDIEQYNELIDGFSKDLNARSFLSIYRQEDMMVVHIKRDSTGTWDISPASRNDLIMRLQEDQSMRMSFKYSFTRITNNTQVTPTIENSYDVALSDSPGITDNLIKQLNFETYDPGTVLGLIPLYIQVPALSSPEPAGPLLPQSSDYGNATLHLSNGSVSELSGDVEWWEASENETDIRLLTFNERVASELLAPLTSYGIIGLYVSLVLVIGRFVRMYFSGVSYQIMFNELPNVDRILKLCLDIYLVRESGEMELEEDLTAKLIFLYRSPETIIKVTKWKTD